MKMLKDNCRLCSDGPVWLLTREMAYELWIFFSNKMSFIKFPEKIYIVHIEEDEN